MKETQHMLVSNESAATQKRFGLSGSTLKLIACFSMLLDHVGAVVLYPYTESVLLTAGYQSIRFQTELYELLRKVGRIAFPIYCFLLVEGFLHTHKVKLYFVRLFLFAVISEIPFNLAFRNKPFDITYQNVFFTLSLGLLALICLQYIEQTNFSKFLKVLLSFLAITGTMAVAYLLESDYSYKGVLAVVMLYLFRQLHSTQMIAGAIAFSWELPAPLAFFFLYFYNQKRGWKMKYFFYIFYPLHLLILYFIKCYLTAGTPGI